jgi:hypothetical protein
MTPKEFREMRATGVAPCGCKVTVEGNQHSCLHGEDCTAKPKAAKAKKEK